MISHGAVDFQHAISGAHVGDRLDVFLYILREKKIDASTCINAITRSGEMKMSDVLNHILDFAAEEFEDEDDLVFWLLGTACVNGKMNIVKTLLKIIDIHSYKELLKRSCDNGRLEIIELFLPRVKGGVHLLKTVPFHSITLPFYEKYSRYLNMENKHRNFFKNIIFLFAVNHKNYMKDNKKKLPAELKRKLLEQFLIA
jgi:hypothetical protein